MSELQEVLSILIGAESEADRIVKDAKLQSENVIKETHDSFEPERRTKMAAAREQAKGIMENATNAAAAETKQIRDRGADDRARLEKRYEERVDALISHVIAETVDKILAGGE